jgi:hypothetical protein
LGFTIVDKAKEMFEKMNESAGNVVGYRTTGRITKDDYKSLVPEVEALVEQEGNIRLLLDMEQFEGEEVKAWGADLKFGLEFRKKIEKLAIVGNKRWEKWLTAVADPFYAQEAEYFTTDDRDAAWSWLRE